MDAPGAGCRRDVIGSHRACPVSGALRRAAVAAVGSGLLLAAAPALPAAAAPGPSPSPTPASSGLVISLLPGLLPGPLASIGTSGGLQVGLLPGVGSTPVLDVDVLGALGVTVGGGGSSTPASPPPPAPSPSASSPRPSVRPPAPAPSSSGAPSARPSSGVAGVPAVGPSASPPSSPAATPRTRRPQTPNAVQTLVSSIGADFPRFLAFLASTVLLAVGALYLLSILAPGRRRGLAVVGAPAVVAFTRADSAARHLGPDGEWDYTFDATPGEG